MSAEKQLIRREITARERDIIGTVISQPRMLDLDQTVDGAPSWVADVDIGQLRPVRNVPIKASGSGARFYAQLGQTVTCRRTALGRLIIIGPGDVSAGVTISIPYSLETFFAGTTENIGYSRVEFPLEYHMGLNAMKGNPNVTFSNSAGTIVRDAGSFITDGFSTGSIRVGRRSALNSGLLTVTGTVTATTLTIVESLTDEGPIDNVTIGMDGTSFWNDGVHFLPYWELQDANGNPV
jgi:hypothetical protein